jgi:hypothetical protein
MRLTPPSASAKSKASRLSHFLEEVGSYASPGYQTLSHLALSFRLAKVIL